MNVKLFVAGSIRQIGNVNMIVPALYTFPEVSWCSCYSILFFQEIKTQRCEVTWVPGLSDEIFLLWEVIMLDHGLVHALLLRMVLLHNWGSPQTKETFFCPAIWDILEWNWEDDHFHINWEGPRSTFLLHMLPLPTPCSLCGLCYWAKGASFDATSDEGSNLWSFFGFLPQRMSQPSSIRYSFSHNTLPFASPSVWPLLWSSLTVGFPNTSPLPTGCSYSSSSSQKMKQKRN